MLKSNEQVYFKQLLPLIQDDEEQEVEKFIQ
jgi:hypothetical protein